jgi:hypothetical protein
MERPLADSRPLGPFFDIPGFGGVTVPEPETDEQAVRVYTPTSSTPTQSAIDDIQSMVNGMSGVLVSIERVDGGLMTAADEAGRGPVEFPHAVLDITETHIKDELGIVEKSTLIAANPENKTLQSCFNPVVGEFSQSELDEISELASFVTGLGVQAEQVEERLYLGTGATQYGHISLDVMEIVSSRVAFAAGHNIQNNSMLIRDRVSE